MLDFFDMNLCFLECGWIIAVFVNKINPSTFKKHKFTAKLNL